MDKLGSEHRILNQLKWQCGSGLQCAAILPGTKLCFGLGNHALFGLPDSQHGLELGSTAACWLTDLMLGAKMIDHAGRVAVVH